MTNDKWQITSRMGGLSWMSRMIQMRRVDWLGWVGRARWSKWVGWVGWARWVDGGNRRLARQSPRDEAKNAKVCKIDNIRYQIIQCNTMQYQKVTKYIPSNAIKKTVQYNTTLYDSIWCISDQNRAFLDQKRDILGKQGSKTAFQAAEGAHTRKPKASRVTWGYGENMIPLSWVCLRPKIGVI